MGASIANVVMAIVIDGLLGAALGGDAAAVQAEQALAICQSVERMPAGDHALGVP